jgi:hypothetical protein
MALVTVNPEGQLIPTAPPPQPTPDTTPYFYEQRSYPDWLLTPEGRINPYLIQMIAGIGAEMDPRGAGGILGRATINYSNAQAAERAYNEQMKNYSARNEELFRILRGWGPMGPKGEMGPTSAQVNPDRSVTIKGNLANDPDQPIKQTDMQGRPVSTGEPDVMRNRIMPPMEPDMPAGRTITNADPERVAQFRGQTRGVQPTPQMYVPTQPTPPVPIPLPVPGIEPAPLPPRPNNQRYYGTEGPTTEVSPTGAPIRRIAMQTESLQAPTDVPQMLEPEVVTAQRELFPGGDAPLGPSQSPIPSRIPMQQAITALSNPPQRQVPQRAERPVEQPVISGGGGMVLPPNAQALLPTPRRRSQTIPDLRDVIPF